MDLCKSGLCKYGSRVNLGLCKFGSGVNVENVNLGRHLNFAFIGVCFLISVFEEKFSQKNIYYITAHTGNNVLHYKYNNCKSTWEEVSN